MGGVMCGPETCLSHLMTPLANLLDYHKINSYLYNFRSFLKISVTWDLGTALSSGGYSTAQTLVAPVMWQGMYSKS